jgi:DNA-binding response OmpR family regulator
MRWGGGPVHDVAAPRFRGERPVSPEGSGVGAEKPRRRGDGDGEASPVTEKKRILVVDDQREILDVTALVLEGAGYAAATASSGDEALDRLTREPFDLVLLDINMPGRDGWETLRLLRADDQLAQLVVVMFSVKGEVSDKVHSLQEGASGYITRPFEVDELVERIGRALEEKEREEEQEGDAR